MPVSRPLGPLFALRLMAATAAGTLVLACAGGPVVSGAPVPPAGIAQADGSGAMPVNPAAQQEEWIQLFNGRDLGDWLSRRLPAA